MFRRLPSVRASLTSGDYSFVGGEEVFAVERKSIADLVQCCTGPNRERFERELHRLRGFRFKRLVIVGDRGEVERHEYRSNVAPAAVLGSLATWEIRFDVPVVWASTPEQAAALIENWASYASREVLKTAKAILGGGPARSEVVSVA